MYNSLLRMVCRFRCLLLGVSVVTILNIICLWHVNYWNESTLNSLEMIFIRKQTTSLMKPLLPEGAAINSSLRSREGEIEENSLKITSPALSGNVKGTLENPDTGHDAQRSQWLSIADKVDIMLRTQADHDHVHWKGSHRTLQDYIKLINVTVVNKNDSEVPLTGRTFQTEQEAVRVCQFSEQSCKAIYKLKELSSSYVVLDSDFLLSSEENSVLYVKPQFIADLEFSAAEMKCGVLPNKTKPKKSSSEEVGCLLPSINPFEKSSMEYFLTMPPLVCDREATLFTKYQDGLLEVITNHDRGAPLRSLSFQTIHGKNDGSDTGFVLEESKPLKFKGPAVKLIHDFVQVNAVFFNGLIQTDFHAQVIAKPDVLQRRPLQKAGLPLNVIILGLDQTSHATFQRLLSSSYKFLREELHAFMFKGFSLVGEATTPQLTALLTGRTIEENCQTHEARTGFKGAGTVDQWPFIFKTLKNYGYATMFSEDAPPIGTFNLRLKGFSKPPCDHYARPFWSAVPHDVNGGVLHEKCINSQPQHNLQLDYLKSFFRAYPTTPKFGFTFLSSLCHRETILPLGAAEKDFLQFFKSIWKSGYLNDTMLVVMGDHGARTGDFRFTIQGKLEERLPMLSITLPTSFRLMYPEFAKNLQLNAEVIMSPLDLHATFMHILKYPLDPSRSDLSRGSSLFSKIPRRRTCEDAHIPRYFCPCVQWLPLHMSHAHVIIGVLRTIDHINTLLAQDPDGSRLCQRLLLDEILDAWQETPNTELRTFTAIQNGLGLGFGSPDFNNSTTFSECHYLVKFRTKPGYGIFEASVKLNQGRFVVGDRISRINLYGSQPDCIRNSHPHLREFCYCGHYN